MKDTPEYRIDVKARNNLILEKMEEVGIKNVAELARLSKVTPAHLGTLINLKTSPFDTISSTKSEPRWKESVKKVAETLGCLPEKLFPDDIAVLNKNTVSMKVRAETIWAMLEHRQESVRALLPETIFAASELQEKLDEVLAGLTKREQAVLRERFFNDKTLEEVGKQLGVTKERVRQIEARALRKLRHPSRRDALVEAGAIDGEILSALSAS